MGRIVSPECVSQSHCPFEESSSADEEQIANKENRADGLQGGSSLTSVEANVLSTIHPELIAKEDRATGAQHDSLVNRLMEVGVCRSRAIDAERHCSTFEAALEWLESTSLANTLMQLGIHPSKAIDAEKHCSSVEEAIDWLDAAGSL